MMGNAEIGHSEKGKYLGDYIHEKGKIESISVTIKAEKNGLKSKCDEIMRSSLAESLSQSLAESPSQSLA